MLLKKKTMSEIKDGIYIFMSAGAGGEQPLGRFQINGNRIVYATKEDEAEIGDVFPAGDMNEYARHNVMKYLSGHGSYSYLKREAD
jgi:hypothetical protein